MFGPDFINMILNGFPLSSGWPFGGGGRVDPFTGTMSPRVPVSRPVAPVSRAVAPAPVRPPIVPIGDDVVENPPWLPVPPPPPTIQPVPPPPSAPVPRLTADPNWATPGWEQTPVQLKPMMPQVYQPKQQQTNWMDAFTGRSTPAFWA